MNRIAMLVLVLCGCVSVPAHAQFDFMPRFWEKEDRPRAVKPPAAARSMISCRTNQPAEIPSRTLRSGNVIVVVLCDQHFVAFHQYGVYDHGPVSTGMIGFETPPGHYRICRHEGAGYRSDKYPLPNGGAPMPWATFFCRPDGSETGMAFHGGDLNRPAAVRGKPYGMSHGCIRMSAQQAHSINFWSRQYQDVEVIVVRDLQEFYEEWDKVIWE